MCRERDIDESSMGQGLREVYRQLRNIAKGYMRRERAGHTLQPTALVHEAYLKLHRAEGSDWEHQTRFVAFAARAMRQVLVDHARRYMADKRKGHIDRVPLTMTSIPHSPPLSPEEILDLDQALETLGAQQPNGRRYVSLIDYIWFGGLSLTEAANELSISRRQATRDWSWSRIWLERALSDP